MLQYASANAPTATAGRVSIACVSPEAGAPATAPLRKRFVEALLLRGLLKIMADIQTDYDNSYMHQACACLAQSLAVHWRACGRKMLNSKGSFAGWSQLHGQARGMDAPGRMHGSGRCWLLVL